MTTSLDMEPKPSKISFLMLFNHIKGVAKPHKEGEVDEFWLERKSTKEQRLAWKTYLDYYQKEGI